MAIVRTCWFVLALLLSAPVWAYQTRVVSIPSAAMQRSFDATVVLPDDYARGKHAARFPVIYVLHGSGGSYADWTSNTRIGKLADRYHVVLVMPDGGHESWYIDSPFDPRSRYETYVGSEVVSYIDMHFRTIAAREARGRVGPRLQQRDHVFALVGGEIERREIRVALLRRHDAALVLAVERLGVVVRGGGVRGGRVRLRHRGGREPGRHRRAACLQEAAPRRARRGCEVVCHVGGHFASIRVFTSSST